MICPERESHIDYTIQVEENLVPEFEANLASGPEHEIIGKVSSLRSPKIEESWGKELADLKGLIEQVGNAYAEGNNVAVEGFKQLYSKENKFLKIRERSFDSLDEFVLETLGILNNGYESYSSDTERPVKKREGTAIYLKRGDGLFSPRQIRLLVKAWGLNGRVVPFRELGRTEGYAPGYSSASVVKQAVGTAEVHLAWALSPNYAYSTEN